MITHSKAKHKTAKAAAEKISRYPSRAILMPGLARAKS
jgi:hypothetical protein